MANQSNQPVEIESRDADHWAQPVSRLKVGDVPSKALGINVEGKALAGPLRGFGQMWHKLYRVRLCEVPVTPAEVIKGWRENFCQFWPKGNTFYGSVSKGIAPGEVAVLHLSEVGGRPLISTGIYVIYADDESFAFITPEGHPIAGMITFSAYVEADCTVAQAECIVRANDPLYEIGMRFGAGRAEDRFWQHTLQSLAAHFGVQTEPQTTAVLLDPKVQWRQIKNIWHNAGARTALYTITTPLRWLRQRVT